MGDGEWAMRRLPLTGGAKNSARRERDCSKLTAPVLSRSVRVVSPLRFRNLTRAVATTGVSLRHSVMPPPRNGSKPARGNLNG
jgi:hypothetical protein